MCAGFHWDFLAVWIPCYPLPRSKCLSSLTITHPFILEGAFKWMLNSLQLLAVEKLFSDKSFGLYTLTPLVHFLIHMLLMNFLSYRYAVNCQHWHFIWFFFWDSENVICTLAKITIRYLALMESNNTNRNAFLSEIVHNPGSLPWSQTNWESEYVEYSQLTAPYSDKPWETIPKKDDMKKSI